MFTSISGPELLMILIVGLLLFGPKRLPKIGRTMGKAFAEFRRATTDFRMNLEREVDAAEIREEPQRAVPGSVSRDAESVAEPSEQSDEPRQHDS